MSAWNFAVPDWAERLKAGQSLVPSLPLDLEAASRAVQIFNKLHLPDMPGLPALADAGADWQRDLVRALFGSLVEGERMVPELFAMVPKKNGKTTFGAAFTLVGMLMNMRPRAEFVYVGPTQEVADVAFQQTVGMIEADPDGYLQKRFHVHDHMKTIVDRRNKARLKVKTFDMKVVVGSKPVFVLLDEIHQMSLNSQAGRIIGQLRGGLLPNREAMLVMITTQSDEPPSGIFKAELQYARGVRDGRIRNGVRMLPVLYEFPEAMQTDPQKPWQNPINWPMVLPNAGRSITVDRLVADYAAAKEKGEAEERRWASQHLNVEIGLALHNARWRGADYWLDAGDSSLTFEEILTRCDCVTLGVDGGGLDDMLGLAVIGRDRDTRQWLLWTHAWVQTDVLDLRKDISERLRDFEADGDLTICESTTQDVDELVDYCVRAQALLPAENAIGLDPYGITAIVDALAAQGLAERLTAIRQGAALSPASWGMERKLKDGTLLHCASALMAWVVGNAQVEQRGNAVLITKQAAGKAKIDPLVAAFNAAMLMARNPEVKREPSYQILVGGGHEAGLLNLGNRSQGSNRQRAAHHQWNGNYA